eukprot:TRINITY_DN4150_c0_g1_i3.p1 TRINITY_DN4150_c0_g1~~TRINITY_DN4150_c0_g1_i3.p1  ORF type:complete len:286 (-),score=40.22 TRINITY_DN4150_c0_g1_i3:484-1233(-)
MGVKDPDIIYLIDFGLAKKYRDTRSNEPLPYRENKPLTGTVRYSSINTHLGIEQSRRDDLEALGYMFLYFLRGSLPWQGLKANTKEDKYKLITCFKIETSVEDLVSIFPKEFGIYLYYCRSLCFHATPDYKFLRELFLNLLTKMGEKYDFKWDWSVFIPSYFSTPLKKGPGSIYNGPGNNGNRTSSFATSGTGGSSRGSSTAFNPHSGTTTFLRSSSTGTPARFSRPNVPRSPTSISTGKINRTASELQ